MAIRMNRSEKLKELTDDIIIKRVLEGDKPVYELIVRRYNPYLYKVGRSYNYNHEDTQDLMQETYIDAYKNLHSFENRSNFKTWITRIMLNNCYRRKEKLSYKNEFTQDEINENIEPMFSDRSTDTNRQIQKKELNSIIENALSKLSEEYRMVFSMREISGFNIAETADLLKISEANVKVRLNRAKAMLRDILGRENNVPELFEFNLVYCDPFTARLLNEIEKL